MKKQLETRIDNLVKAIDSRGGDEAKLDFPLRVELLRLKSEIAGLNLPSEVINFVAQKVDTSLVELEDFSTELIARATSQRKSIDTNFTRRFYESKKREIKK